MEFKNDNVHGRVEYTSKSLITVKGKINGPVASLKIKYIAAAPANYSASFTGSGLPFPSFAFATDDTPNKGEAQLDHMNEFKFTIAMPNSYYGALGTVLVPPTVYVLYEAESKVVRRVAIKLEEPIPYRTLTYQNGRTSAEFYNIPLPVRSQEQILRDSAYPVDSTLIPANHWGLKPPF